MSFLRCARDLLHREDYSCVLMDKNRVLTSRARGISPILTRLDQDESLQGMVCADKIIGKAAAMLLLCGGIAEVYGQVVSRDAKTLLEAKGVKVTYGQLTDGIVNRQGTGPCPMEQTVADLTDPWDAPAALRETLRRLLNKK